MEAKNSVLSHLSTASGTTLQAPPDQLIARHDRKNRNLENEMQEKELVDLRQTGKIKDGGGKFDNLCGLSLFLWRCALI